MSVNSKKKDLRSIAEAGFPLTEEGIDQEFERLAEGPESHELQVVRTLGHLMGKNGEKIDALASLTVYDCRFLDEKIDAMERLNFATLSPQGKKLVARILGLSD